MRVVIKIEAESQSKSESDFLSIRKELRAGIWELVERYLECRSVDVSVDKGRAGEVTQLRVVGTVAASSRLESRHLYPVPTTREFKEQLLDDIEDSCPDTMPSTDIPITIAESSHDDANRAECRESEEPLFDCNSGKWQSAVLRRTDIIIPYDGPVGAHDDRRCTQAAESCTPASHKSLVKIHPILGELWRANRLCSSYPCTASPVTERYDFEAERDFLIEALRVSVRD